MMPESWKRPALLAAGLVVLIAALWFASSNSSSSKATSPAAGRSATATSTPTTADRLRLDTNRVPGALRSTRTNPVKAALRDSTWQIVSRKAGAVATSSTTPEAGDAENSASAGAAIQVGTTRFSLEFVRADFESAGLRGVEQFAAFSPPQFAAIKTALEKHAETSISAAPDEFAPEGEAVHYDLVNAEDDREFAVAFTSTPAADKQTLQLHIVTGGSTRRRDTTIAIWDGQTVSIPLAQTPGTRTRLALFLTTRLIGTDGDPVNQFVVKQ